MCRLPRNSSVDFLYNKSSSRLLLFFKKVLGVRGWLLSTGSGPAGVGLIENRVNGWRANKLAYRVGEIHRGDVVVFLYPHDHEKSYIKRVIAGPGDI